MWDTAVTGLVAAWRADATLMTALGSNLDPSESTVQRKVPGARYTVIADIEEETLNPVTIQVDYWAMSRAKAMAIEQRLRKVAAARRRMTVGGVAMWVLYLDSRDMDDPQPGVVHRSLDFRCVPVRAS